MRPEHQCPSLDSLGRHPLSMTRRTIDDRRPLYFRCRPTSYLKKLGCCHSAIECTLSSPSVPDGLLKYGQRKPFVFCMRLPSLLFQRQHPLGRFELHKRGQILPEGLLATFRDQDPSHNRTYFELRNANTQCAEENQALYGLSHARRGIRDQAQIVLRRDEREYAGWVRLRLAGHQLQNRCR